MGRKRLLSRPGLEERAIDAEVLVAQQLGRAGLAQHRGEESLGELAAERGERVHGWIKTIALLRKVRHRGEERVDWIFTFALAVYDLVRLRTLLAERTA